MILAVLFLIVLISCKDTTPQPPSVPTPPPSGVPLSQTEERLLQEHNRQRTQRNLNPLQINQKLCLAARQHALWMAQRETLSHTGPGTTLTSRVQQAGYRYRYIGENIAATSRLDAVQVLGLWLDSRGHRENLLNRQFVEIGLAVEQSAQGRYYWCVVFGQPAQPF